MAKIDANTLKEAEKHVLKLLSTDLPEGMYYHSPDHTRFVVQAVETIGKETGLEEHEMNIARMAAWFHDVGYVYSQDDHESESIRLAESFLNDKNIDDQDIHDVVSCIEATRVPQSPKSDAARVLCDADMMHLASPDYYAHIDRMRKERKYLENRKISKQEFDQVSMTFFRVHEYFTEYGQNILQQGKDKNFAMIQDNIQKRDTKKGEEIKGLNKDLDKLRKKLEKQKGYSRGVESMFRLTARNQINLSSIADNKSNILISVNTIIISIVLTVLVSRFAEYPNIILPSLVFLTFSLITIIFAILSTRPHISSGRFTREDIEQKKVNLLFFGNFYNMGLDDYNWALNEMMRDDDYLYTTMIKDQYFLGKVLAKKYKLLRYAYNFFMFGIIISVLAYVFAFINI
jgi:predicted metal-dependent HD superfamily phosphohydrolase